MGEWELENLDHRARHPDDARSKFERWVLAFGGSYVVAQAVGVHQVSVCAWTSRRSKPNLEATMKILELAGKELSIHDIYEGTRPN